MSHSVPPGSLLRRGGSLLYFGNRLVKLLWTRTRGVRNSSSVLHKARRKCWCFIGRCNPWAARVSEREGGGTGKDGEEMLGDALPSRPGFGERNSWSLCHVGRLRTDFTETPGLRTLCHGGTESPPGAHPSLAFRWSSFSPQGVATLGF